MKIEADLHIHTTLSACCSDSTQTPENLKRYLPELGIRRFALTDHVWANPAIPPSAWYRPQNGDAILKLKNIFAEKNILTGCEAEMQAPGVFGITPDFREKMDIVLIASDHFHMKEFVQQPAEKTPQAIAKHMMDFFRSAAYSGLADILCHPLWPYSFTDVYPECIAALSDGELEDAFGLAAENNAALELNGTVIRKAYSFGPAWVDAMRRIFLLAKDAGCKFTPGSDSHDRERFSVYEDIRIFADEAGITDNDLAEICKVEE